MLREPFDEGTKIDRPSAPAFVTRVRKRAWILISRNKKRKGETLFIDARKMGTMVNRCLREITTEDIIRPRIPDIIRTKRADGIRAKRADGIRPYAYILRRFAPS